MRLGTSSNISRSLVLLLGVLGCSAMSARPRPRQQPLAVDAAVRDSVADTASPVLDANPSIDAIDTSTPLRVTNIDSLFAGCRRIDTRGADSALNVGGAPWFVGREHLRWPREGNGVLGWLRLRANGTQLCVAASLSFFANENIGAVHLSRVYCDERAVLLGVRALIHRSRTGFEMRSDAASFVSGDTEGVVRGIERTALRVAWDGAKYIVTGGGNVSFSNRVMLNTRPWFWQRSECEQVLAEEASVTVREIDQRH